MVKYFVQAKGNTLLKWVLGKTHSWPQGEGEKQKGR